MKEKIRNSVIEMSNSKDLDLKMSLMAIVSIIIACLMCLGPKLIQPLSLVMIAVALMVAWIWECLNAIKKTKEDIIRRNKIVNIVLADENVWEIPIMVVFVSLTTIIWTVLGGEPDLFVAAIWFVMVFAGIAILGEVLPRIFKKRLK